MSEQPQGVDQTLATGPAGNTEQPDATQDERIEGTFRADPDQADSVRGAAEAERSAAEGQAGDGQ